MNLVFQLYFLHLQLLYPLTNNNNSRDLVSTSTYYDFINNWYLRWNLWLNVKWKLELFTSGEILLWNELNISVLWSQQGNCIKVKRFEKPWLMEMIYMAYQLICFKNIQSKQRFDWNWWDFILHTSKYRTIPWCYSDYYSY